MINKPHETHTHANRHDTAHVRGVSVRLPALLLGSVGDLYLCGGGGADLSLDLPSEFGRSGAAEVGG